MRIHRPADHTGEELWLELQRIRSLGVREPWASNVREVLRRHRHLLWRHEHALDRDAWTHTVPGARGLRRLELSLVGRLAYAWARRRRLPRGLLEGRRIRWQWAVGDFTAELLSEIRELERQLVEEAQRHEHERDRMAATLRPQLRREILEELDTMARARQRDRAGAPH